MRELTFEENRAYQLEILKDVAKFCDDNNIRYFLAYGTLIGAARHKGFIPWDDDIDIQMPREDYNKFIKTYKSKHYEVISPYDKRAKHSMAKVIDTRTIKIEKAVRYKKGEELGIDIDIFPLDGQPDDEKDFLKYYRKKHRLYKGFYFTISSWSKYSLKGKIAYAIPYLIANLMGKNYFLDKANQIGRKYEFDKSKYIGTTATLYETVNNRNLKEWYSSSTELQFENNSFKVPVGYHNVLTKLYGDYMTPPPQEQQVTHHTNKVLLK